MRAADSSPSLRLPAWVAAAGALGFVVWSAILVSSPGGSAGLEFTQMLASAAVLALAGSALRRPTPGKTRWLRRLLLAFAVGGAVAVIGLAADNTSSRTFARLAWMALIAGATGSALVWRQASRAAYWSGVVAALLAVAAGAGITLNCDPGPQRSWCDPSFEQEQALAEQVSLIGSTALPSRPGGNQGPAMKAAQLEPGASINDLVGVPPGFEYQSRPTHGFELERGRYTTATGGYSHCVIDAVIEETPSALVARVSVSCR